MCLGRGGEGDAGGDQFCDTLFTKYLDNQTFQYFSVMTAKNHHTLEYFFQMTRVAQVQQVQSCTNGTLAYGKKADLGSTCADL